MKQEIINELEQILSLEGLNESVFTKADDARVHNWYRAVNLKINELHQLLDPKTNAAVSEILLEHSRTEKETKNIIKANINLRKLFFKFEPLR